MFSSAQYKLTNKGDYKLTNPYTRTLLTDRSNRIVPQYFDHVSGSLKPIAKEDVSHINVRDTQLLRANNGDLTYQYLKADGSWEAFNLMDIGIKSVNGQLPDEDGNVTLGIEHIDALLETIALVGGVPGPRGEQGEQGVPGRDGIDGVNGIDGKDGRDGVDGAPGPQGLPGRDGIDGTNGRDGIDGKDGVDGAQGPQGIPGKDGKDGRDGTNGVDGKDGKPGAILYSDSGLVIEQVKMFYGISTVVGTTGEWSIDISAAEFNAVLNVQATVLAGSFNAANAPVTSNIGTVSVSSINGKAFKATSAGLLAAMQQTPAEPGTQVYVTVIGV